MPAQNLDQRQLLETAVCEGTAAFKAAIAKYPNERFYAYCLYTDNDVTSVYPTANSVEGFQRICSSDDPADRNYYQWAPAEWKLDFGRFRDPDLMAETNKLLFRSYDPPEPEEQEGEFGERKRRTLLTLTHVLLSIRETGVFAGHALRDRLAFWVNIGDAMQGEIEWMFQPVIPHLESHDIDELRKLFQFTCV